MNIQTSMAIIYRNLRSGTKAGDHRKLMKYPLNFKRRTIPEEITKNDNTDGQQFYATEFRIP
jgi:hypothetical protein